MNLHNLEGVRLSCWMDERYNIDYENVYHLNVRFLMLVFGSSTNKTLHPYNFCIRILNKAYFGVLKPMSFVNERHLETCDLLLLIIITSMLKVTILAPSTVQVILELSARFLKWSLGPDHRHSSGLFYHIRFARVCRDRMAVKPYCNAVLF